MAGKSFKKVIAIVGSTGSGKTSFALEFCDPKKHEIINGDSMQVYRQISIGNNKGKLYPISQKDEGELLGIEPQYKPVYLSNKKKVVSWLFDIVDITDDFSVADYQKSAREVIIDIQKRGKTPVIVGGSGLYVYAALYDVDLQQSAKETQRQLKIKKSFGTEVKELQKRLIDEGFDLDSLNNSDRNNPRRLQNYLYKLLYADEESYTDQNLANKKALYSVEFKIMDLDEKNLEKRLKKRVDSMIDEGFIEECMKLLKVEEEEGVSSQIKTASGYKEVFDYLDLDESERDLNELKENIYRSHRRLAKKQEKWNKKFFQI